MPDITMCSTNTCHCKESCYRYTAEPNEFNQSWCDFSSHIMAGLNGFECDNFILAYQIVTMKDANG